MDERTGQRSQPRLGNGNQGEGTAKNQISAPSISLPKGGGAIRGMGEKFAANPVTGTGSMSVPIATSPGRSGFGPQLSLAYDSGAGNGPFGLGWNLSLPSITRKTDKGLPKYQDVDESDVFILSGAEDLVPTLVQDAAGKWVLEIVPPRTVNGQVYLVRRYRPRIEGLFARIERWTNQADSKDCFWRSISKDNITTFYGKSEASQIADPSDQAKIFSWLICESYDDKGNAILYSYKEEDDEGIELAQVHERNRTTQSRSANRYLKNIIYGNTRSHLDQAFATREAWKQATEWLFEVVLDYGEGHYQAQAPNAEGRIFAQAALAPPLNRSWPVRQDPFSAYRAGFEVRTYRLCRRVLMFHHFENELGTPDCLVRSTEFSFNETPIASFITQATQSGYVRQTNGNYLKKSLPPVEFEYSEAKIDQTVREIDSESLENLPYGLDGANYQWVDLDGEGLSGILTEQANGWFYKRNLSPAPLVPDNGIAHVEARFAPVELVAVKPTASIASGHAQLMDLAGDGQLDLVEFSGFTPGFFEHTDDGDWDPFTPFASLPNVSWNDPNLKFVDLTGDGHADVLISEDNVFTWYPSLAEEGFAAAERVSHSFDEEKGPKLVFADTEQSIYLADLSGDGLTDLVRIRNGEICYWPNLGYGHFGAKVTMDEAPWFDHPDQFDQKRIRLADIDGSGTTDIIYLGRHQIDVYRNQAGNRWSKAESLTIFPQVDNISAVQTVDLLGNGTACLVWSSPLPGDARRPMRYIALMGEQKPHLLTNTVNNLGAETVVHYAPSTKFYVQDKLNGKPWITKLPFPVHVVERVETYDHISRNRFVSRYAYHHGYFDGEEREFRGFGMVEQQETEDFAALTGDGTLPEATNLDAASHVPPVLTKTWFHTGVFVDRDYISNFFAGLIDDHDRGEYYREPAWRDDDVEARKRLLDDTVLPVGLSVEEEREACRALKGSMLRQETYALDGTGTEDYPHGHPYTVTEQNFTIECLQPQDGNRHAVFFSHAREAINYHYEREPTDPRVSHALTLEVDKFGNVLQSAAIGYGRRQPDMALSPADRAKQTQILVTYTENRVTNAIEAADDHRTPLPCEVRTYELTRYPSTGTAGRFQISDFVKPDPLDDKRLIHVFDSEIRYEEQSTNGKQRRLIEQVRTRYRKNDLTGLLALGTAESLALAGESYKLAFTPGLLAQVFKRPRDGQPPENLIPNPANVFRGQLADRGGYVDLDGDGRWWIPSGQVFYAPEANVANPAATAAQELAEARQHFFLPRKFADPFGQGAIVDYEHDLLVVKTKDALDNTVQADNDYRVLQPRLVTDPNANRVEGKFDALGLVVGTAVMGKTTENLGDSLAGFVADLTQKQIDDFFNAVDPHTLAEDLLKSATSRIIYDVDCFRRSSEINVLDATKWLPPIAATLVRETHATDPVPAGGLKIQISFSYSDGFGREIQKKIQAEPGPVVDGGLVVNPRWVGSGWTIFNNKGKPVRQYEPFFGKLPGKRHQFEFGNKVGVSPILFYDPVERVVATLHPNHTWEKVVFDPWRQETWDVNDTVALDPRDDQNVKGFVLNPDGTFRLPTAEYTPTWHALRTDPANLVEANLRWPDPKSHDAEKSAAEKAAIHAKTLTIAHFDSLGRPFLTLAHNGFKPDDTPIQFPTRVELDIEANQRAVFDALDRTVMRYDYDMLGNRIHQASMEAGERWSLNDVTGKPIRAWDSRGHDFKTEYDQLRRPVRQFVRGTDAKHSDPRTLNRDVLFEKFEYGEGQPNAIALALNLRTRVFKQYDGAGIVTSEAYDFKGNLLASTRELLSEYKNLIDWGVAQPAGEKFGSSTSYDALNRPVTLTTPDNSVIRPTYNEANLLNAVKANLPGAATATSFITNIDYNAKGQRILIEYGTRDGAGIATTYGYDPDTFRLIDLKTRRNAAGFDGTDRPGEVQSLHYTYDPVGNITHIRDDAQQTVYFRNKRVEPSAEYIYDAIYRLIEATGREHLGQAVGGAALPPTPLSYNDKPRTGLLHPGDGNAMGRYIQQYIYDEVGNFKEMIHRGTDPVHPGWTRAYAYDEPSLLEAAKTSNRLTSTTIGATTETYSAAGDGYDPHGNMLRMPQLQIMQWDFKDRLLMTQRQKVNNEDEDGIERQGERTYYVYDAGGQRVRKVTELATGDPKDERIYLVGFEIYRRHGANALVRETLHIMDDKQRIALVETRTQGNEPGVPAQLIRYQFGNHLGSASLELDDQAQIISYEEYYPYGSTSYQAVRSQTEMPKRYRYTGKERDEESGLYYYGARYYASWLGRWASCDPAEFADGLNLYAALKGRPNTTVDRNGTTTDDDRPSRLDVKQAQAARKAQEQLTNLEAASNEVRAAWKKYENLQEGIVDQLRRMASEDTPQVDEAEIQKQYQKQLEKQESAIKKAEAKWDKQLRKTEKAIDRMPLGPGKLESASLKEQAGRLKRDLGATKLRIKSRREEAARLNEQVAARGKKKPPGGGGTTGGGPSGGGGPKGGPPDPSKGSLAKLMDSASEQFSSSKAGKVIATVVPILAKGVVKAAPLIGTAAGAYGVATELEQGNVRRATLEAIGTSEIPFVSQTADIGLAVEDAGWAAKEILDPEQRAEQWFYDKFLN